MFYSSTLPNLASGKEIFYNQHIWISVLLYYFMKTWGINRKVHFRPIILPQDQFKIVITSFAFCRMNWSLVYENHRVDVKLICNLLLSVEPLLAGFTRRMSIMLSLLVVILFRLKFSVVAYFGQHYSEIIYSQSPLSSCYLSTIMNSLFSHVRFRNAGLWI